MNLKLFINKLSDFVLNVSIGLFVAALNFLSLHIYLNKDDYILGEWSLYLLIFVSLYVLSLIGKGLKEETKKQLTRSEYDE
ncbi:hypothetical protein [Bacillus infantis]|uniref:hypothetical protein n=1 Tax=Bacillus infantis TaxID=324767 RepID=UPI003CEE4B5A